ncbi:NUDIX hydrolase [Rhabdothermincola sediminis]|uniref:NUDIX hydrolase n=1 Tax=Rhabdothermincola sediminis TaxID=2751370 RepID=UPI001AA072F6|nr:NUDIX hydrolase [Rhabdothermincola sediminis]
MRWTVHGERTLYRSDWLRLTLVDVEVPGIRRFEHHVVRSTAPAVGVIVHDPDRGVLLLWRHRFITDTWGWEIPAGRVDAGESLEQAAAREALEETGWRPGPLERLASWFPTNGLSDQSFTAYLASGAVHVGEPTDPSEAERVEWVPVDRVVELLAQGAVTDGLSLTGLATALALGRLR